MTHSSEEDCGGWREKRWVGLSGGLRVREDCNKCVQLKAEVLLQTRTVILVEAI